MKRVRVFGIVGCKLCDNVKAELYERDIEYSFVDVNTNNALADKIEDLIGTDNYPIILLETKQSSSYFYFPDNAVELGIKSVNENIKKIGVYDVGDVVSMLKGLLKD